MSFAKFMASTAGRVIRVIAGLSLVLVGLSTGTYWLAVVGLVPLATGVLNVCAIAPLLKGPFSGKAALDSH